MSGRFFLDTNVIIYLYSEDEDSKRQAVYNLLDEHICITSTQVFNESSNIWFKKYCLSKTHIKKYLNEIEAVCDEVTVIQRKTIDYALDIKERYGFSYYDCLMLASALEGNCGIIFSEDMRDGQIIEGRLKISNPFKNRTY
ncbi:MAG: PIN domain-containing protein [Clostridiales bacterium]|jgi:predicted nucleic acid-binding protein|nr:PIN domain-containing protein [Clostridiales bacterium]